MEEVPSPRFAPQPTWVPHPSRSLGRVGYHSSAPRSRQRRIEYLTVVRSPAADTPFDCGWSGRTMHSRCAFVRHSLSFRSGSCFLDSHLRFAYAQTSPDPSMVTIDGLGKGTVDLSGPWRFHIGDDLRLGRAQHQRHSGRKRLGNHPCRSPVGRAKITMPMRALPGTGCTFASHPHLMSKPASNCCCPACKTSAKCTGTAGWWAGTESCLRTRPRRS